MIRLTVDALIIHTDDDADVTGNEYTNQTSRCIVDIASSFTVTRNDTAASSIISIDVARNDNTSYTLTCNNNVAFLVDFSCIDVRDTIRIIAVIYIDADDASVVSQNGTTTICIIDVTCIVDS